MKKKNTDHRVGYVKFISTKPREEIEKDWFVFSSNKRTNFKSKDKTKFCLRSLTNGSMFELIATYSTDKYFLDYFRECHCANIKEITPHFYKKLKIQKPYHLYQAVIYKPPKILESFTIIEEE